MTPLFALPLDNARQRPDHFWKTLAKTPAFSPITSYFLSKFQISVSDLDINIDCVLVFNMARNNKLYTILVFIELNRVNYHATQSKKERSH